VTITAYHIEVASALESLQRMIRVLRPALFKLEKELAWRYCGVLKNMKAVHLHQSRGG